MSFRTYESYRDSGIRWLGRVPSGWTVKAIKHCFSVVGGSTPKSDVDEFWDGEHVWVTPADLSGLPGFGIVDSARRITDAGFESCGTTMVPTGSIVLSTRAPIGSLAIAGTTLCTNQGCKSLVPKPGVVPRYFAYVLSIAGEELNLRGRGTTFLELSADALGAFEVVVPMAKEQADIATFLDRETAKIDALVEEQRCLIELLKEKRQAVISQAVTKGLDPSVPMKDSGVEWLGKVPAHWEIGGLTRFIGPVVDYRGRTPTKVDEGVFLVTARNIRNGKIDYTASEEYVDAQSAESLLDRGRPEIGDLLFTMEAPLGQVALIDRVDIALAQRVVKFRGRPDVLQSNFLLYWFMGDHCQARLTTLATGSTALGIKASKLGMIECLVPPLDEQAAIVRYVEREFEALDALIEQAQVASSLLVERRSALISAAVTGKIDVRGLTPQ